MATSCLGSAMPATACSAPNRPVATSTFRGAQRVGLNSGGRDTSQHSLFPPSTLLAKAHLLGESGARLGVGRSNHRVVRR